MWDRSVSLGLAGGGQSVPWERSGERCSGSRHYRPLNRGDDRQANAALHPIVQSRLRFDPRTRDYYERRIKEGKARREIVRYRQR